MDYNICELVREAETNYLAGFTRTSKYVESSLYEDVSTIDAYLNSTHISGATDSQDRDKPFFNIVVAARNIRYRATDIDTKDIVTGAGKSTDYVASFLANVVLQDWMKREHFGIFLNEWGITLAGYDTAVVKCIETGKELSLKVMNWNKIMVDPIDFDNNPKIEMMEFTPAQLRQNENYNQEMVEALIDAVSARELIDKSRVDNKSNYIKVYEIHGNVSLSYMTDKKKDEKKYVQQMHVVSFVANKKGDYDDYTLYKGKEKKDPYYITYLIKEDGQTLGNGVVKQLFNAQWMVNHSIKNQKDYLDLVSKIVLQTADPAFANKNFLDDIESGQIMVFDQTKAPGGITRVSMDRGDITNLSNFKDQWIVLANQLNSTPDILRGENLPSGTAYRQAAIVQQEAHSNYEMMIENKGLGLVKILREFVLPYLKRTQLSNADEISAILEAHNVTKIDALYINTEAVKRFNRKAVEAVLNDEELPNFQEEQQGVRQELSVLGNQRFFKPSELDDITWKEILKDYEWELDINPTGETFNKEVLFNTLTTVLQTVASNPGVLQDPNMKMLFNKILGATGEVSPVELSISQSAPPQGQPVGVGANQIPQNGI